MTDVVAFLAEYGGEIFAVLALLLSAAALVARMTPTDKDDKIVSKVRSVVDFFAGFVKRKPAPQAAPVSLESDQLNLPTGAPVPRARLDRK